MEFIQDLWTDITEMGIRHNVNPLFFAALYFGSIPPYMASMIWTVKNYRKQKRIALPVLSTLFFFILPALYVLIFGRDVAWWVYTILAGMILYGSYSLYRTLKAKLKSTPSKLKNPST